MSIDEDVIHFVMTGGTMDSMYDGSIDTVVPRESSAVPRYMVGVKLDRKLKFTEVCVKDSRTLNAEDRRSIVETIENSDARKFIVTHGIYTLPDTARYVQEHLRAKDKIVVLTGSSIPIDGITMSDAGFSLGYAYAQADILPPGVHVCRNGRIYTPGEVVKLLDQGRFTSIFRGEA